MFVEYYLFLLILLVGRVCVLVLVRRLSHGRGWFVINECWRVVLLFIYLMLDIRPCFLPIEEFACGVQASFAEARGHKGVHEFPWRESLPAQIRR
ncbi:MAG: hypothetical protein ACREXR_08730, partial [Gammaproteobacteria bacterium]